MNLLPPSNTIPPFTTFYFMSSKKQMAKNLSVDDPYRTCCAYLVWTMSLDIYNLSFVNYSIFNEFLSYTYLVWTISLGIYNLSFVNYSILMNFLVTPILNKQRLYKRISN